MILSFLILVGQICLTSYTVTRFEPLQRIVSKFLTNSNSDRLGFKGALGKVLSCVRCLSLWVGIIVFGNVWAAMLASLIMFIYDKNFSTWENKINV